MSNRTRTLGRYRRRFRFLPQRAEKSGEIRSESPCRSSCNETETLRWRAHKTASEYANLTYKNENSNLLNAAWKIGKLIGNRHTQKGWLSFHACPLLFSKERTQTKTLDRRSAHEEWSPLHPSPYFTSFLYRTRYHVSNSKGDKHHFVQQGYKRTPHGDVYHESECHRDAPWSATKESKTNERNLMTWTKKA